MHDGHRQSSQLRLRRRCRHRRLMAWQNTWQRNTSGVQNSKVLDRSIHGGRQGPHRPLKISLTGALTWLGMVSRGPADTLDTHWSGCNNTLMLMGGDGDGHEDGRVRWKRGRSKRVHGAVPQAAQATQPQRCKWNGVANKPKTEAPECLLHVLRTCRMYPKKKSTT